MRQWIILVNNIDLSQDIVELLVIDERCDGDDNVREHYPKMRPETDFFSLIE